MNLLVALPTCDEYAASANPLNWMRCGGGDGGAVGDGDAAGAAAGDGTAAGDGAGDGDVCACAACVPANAIKLNATSDKSFFKNFPFDRINSADAPNVVPDACSERKTGRLNVPGNRAKRRGRRDKRQVINELCVYDSIAKRKRWC